MINNKKEVQVYKKIVTEQIDNVFDGLDGKLKNVFQTAINNAINKTAHDINFDIINKGQFDGFGGK